MQPLRIDTALTDEDDGADKKNVENLFVLGGVTGWGSSSFVRHAVRRADNLHVALKPRRSGDQHTVHHEYEISSAVVPIHSESQRFLHIWRFCARIH